jgi:acetyl esterase/lipase
VPNLVRTTALPTLADVQSLGERVAGRVLSVGLLRWPAVPYGPDPAQQLYLWELHDLAPRDGWPAVILVPPEPDAAGTFAALGPRLAQTGVLAAACGTSADSAAEDLAAALSWLRTQQVDRERLALWGEGAGADLALELARDQSVRAVVALGIDGATLDGTPAPRRDAHRSGDTAKRRRMAHAGDRSTAARLEVEDPQVEEEELKPCRGVAGLVGAAQVAEMIHLDALRRTSQRHCDTIRRR